MISPDPPPIGVGLLVGVVVIVGGLVDARVGVVFPRGVRVRVGMGVNVDSDNPAGPQAVRISITRIKNIPLYDCFIFILYHCSRIFIPVIACFFFLQGSHFVVNLERIDHPFPLEFLY
jgi:hypothetical protein